MAENRPDSDPSSSFASSNEAIPIAAWISAVARLSPAERLSLTRAVLGESACRQLGLYPFPPEWKLSVVIPAFNEIRWLPETLRRVRAVSMPKEILIVDDGSTDGTREFLASLAGEPEVRVYFQPRNLGKGAAIRRGFAEATGQILLIQDADLEYDPHDYGILIQPILDGRADVVYGSRFLGGPHRVLNFWHALGNRCLTTLSNMLTNLNLTDMETGFKVFRRDVIQGMRLRSDRFGIEPELTAKIARRQPRPWRIYEVPIRYAGRTCRDGKKIGWKDLVMAVYGIVRYAIAD